MADALLSWPFTFDVSALCCMNEAPAKRSPHTATSTAKSGHLMPLRSSVPMIILVPRVERRHPRAPSLLCASAHAGAT